MSNSATQPPFKVIIVGGGLAGSLLANGLARHNVNFEVYERQEKNSKREGYQIRLGEDTFIGMRACLDQDQIDSISNHFGRSASSQAPILYDKHFRKIFEPGRDPNYTQSSPISRVILQDALREPLDTIGKIHYQKKFKDFNICPGVHLDIVEVNFDDGTSDVCDILLAADGNNSQINNLCGLNNIEELSSFRSFLTRCDLPLSVCRRLSPDPSSPIATLHDGKTLYFQVYMRGDMTARLENAEAENEEELASCMLGVGFFVDRMATSRSFESLSQTEKWDAVDHLFWDWSPKHRDIIGVFRGQEMYYGAPRVSSRPLTNWRKSVTSADDNRLGNPHIWLIGDSMHSMFPSRGMGGNQAMRDTADALPLLVRLAETAVTTEGLKEADITQACDKYEGAVIPRAFEWVKRSGGKNPMTIDTSRVTDRTILYILSYAVAARRLWLCLRSWITRMIFGIIPCYA
ncbi:FAD/NAD(P)-binding domain-containing protein [Colletotrichum scovillei]|nr:FAD/NAD(P)-binding domain-containing protein [Colletotrichum scovillei]KAG7072779.1 FAD/NAD(P)-binding domain-containing protein [Colletotrichum scovillei]